MRNGKCESQKSCLDHIYVKNRKGSVKGATLTEKISDHNYIMCWIWDNENKFQTEETDQYILRQYNH
jgi:hypothetical protein